MIILAFIELRLILSCMWLVTGKMSRRALP